MGLDFVKVWNFQLVSRITLKPLVLQTWNFRDIFLCLHHLIGGCIDLPVNVRPSVSPSVRLWKVCVKVERGGICVLWTHVCPIYILICLFCKAVVWDGGISFCDRKLASSLQKNLLGEDPQTPSSISVGTALPYPPNLCPPHSSVKFLDPAPKNYHICSFLK